jgi:hypothetical protein
MGPTRTNGACTRGSSWTTAARWRRSCTIGPAGRLTASATAPQALAGSFCCQLVLVGLAHLGVDAPATAALATETAPAGDLRPWLATLSQGELIELVIEAADADRDYRRRLGLRSRTQAAQP